MTRIFAMLMVLSSMGMLLILDRSSLIGLMLLLGL